MKVHNYKYQTKQWMPEHESNLYDFGARIYDPVLARFTTTDPLQQFNNPYMAMGGNPVSMIDPSGMWSYGGYNAAVADKAEAAQWAAKASSGMTNWGSSGPKMFVDGVAVYGANELTTAMSIMFDLDKKGDPIPAENVVSVSTGANTATYYVGYFNGESTGITASYNTAIDNNYDAYREDWFAKTGSAPNRDLWLNNTTGEFIEMPAGMKPGESTSIMSREEFAMAQGGGVMQASLGGDYFNYGGAIMNIGGCLAGIAELSALNARRINNGGGPKSIARAMTYLKGSHVGTQKVAEKLRSFGAGAKSIGVKFGIAGGIIATTDYALNFNEKSGYEHASYWIGTAVTIAAFVNPIGAGVALIYGFGQLGSWLYNGKTLEENVGKSVGW